MEHQSSGDLAGDLARELLHPALCPARVRVPDTARGSQGRRTPRVWEGRVLGDWGPNWVDEAGHSWSERHASVVGEN